MGTYCTTTSLSTIMVGTTFDTATTSLAGQCITWAETEIRKKLSKRYDVSGSNLALTTTSTIPPVITTICEWLSTGYLYDNMSRGSKESHSRAERLIKRAMMNLEELMNDEVDLVLEDGSTVSDKSNRLDVLENSSDYTRTFDEDDVLSWKVDPDKLDDIRDERD